MKRRLDQVLLGNFILLLLTPLLFLPFLYDASPLPKAVALVFVGLAFILVWLLDSGTAKERINLAWSEKVLIAFSGFLLLSTLLSVDRSQSLLGSYQRYEGLIAWLVYLIIYFSVSRLVRSRKTVEVALEIFLWASIAAAVLAMGLYISRLGDAGIRASGTLGNAGLLGSYLVMPIPIGLAFFAGGSGRRKWLGAAAAVSALTALYFSFTRGAWFGLFVALLVMFIMGSKTIKDRWPDFLIVSASTAVLILAIGFAASAQQTTVSSGVERVEALGDLSGGTTATRLEMWKGTAKLILDRPWYGRGLETFRETFRGTPKLAALEDINKKADRPHNHFLYLAFSVGILGAFSYYVFLLGTLNRARSSFGSQADWPRLVSISMVAAVVGYSVQAEFIFSSIEASPTMWLLLGLLVAYSRGQKDKSADVAPPRPAAIKIAAGLTGAALMLWAILGGTALVADYFFLQGLPARENGSSQSIELLEKAVELNPYAPIYKLALGHAYFARGKLTDDRAQVQAAIDTYGQELLRRPNDEFYYSQADALSFYGQRWGDPAKLDAALIAYGQAAKLRPYFPYTFWEMGYVWMLKGRPDKAVGFLKQSLRIDPDNPQVLLGLGAAYEAQGRRLLADQSYRAALRLQPGLRPAVEGIERLK